MILLAAEHAGQQPLKTMTLSLIGADRGDGRGGSEVAVFQKGHGLSAVRHNQPRSVVQTQRQIHRAFRTSARCYVPATTYRIAGIDGLERARSRSPTPTAE